MEGSGGVAPSELDHDPGHDRQAAVVLVVAAAVCLLILFPLGLAVGLIAMAYAHVSGARRTFWAALVIVCIGLLSVILGLTDFDGGAFQG
jgi:uncharacterized membrane protein